MSINLEVLVDTIKERKKDMLNNRALTNELAIDDLMISLGYNKKRDTSVLRLYDNIDWKVVYPTGSRLAVRTFALTDAINEEEAADVFNEAVNEDTAAVILTNGEQINIYAINSIEKRYILICEHNIYEDMDENTSRIFTSISKKGFDRARLDSIVMAKYITTDKVKEWLNKYTQDIIGLIVKEEKLREYERLSPLYTELVNLEPSVVTETVVEVDTETTEKLERLALLETEHSELQSELDKCKEEHSVTLERLSEALLAKEETDRKVEELNAELSDIKVQLEEASNKTNDEALDNAMSQISSLTMQNNSLISQIEKLNITISEKEDEIAGLNNEIAELNSRIEDLNGEVNKLNTLSLDDYIQQIHDLTEQYNCVMEEKEALAAKVKRLQEEINDLEGVDKKKAQELLDVIQVSDDKPRQYVGVINTELFQYGELYKFVGCVLQKLSELKGHLAAQYIFDGDMFSLVPNGERKDLMINNKCFDIELNGMGEEEAINKLRIIFSHFDDLIFDCKLVGHLDESDEIEYTLDQNINRDINADLYEEEKKGFKVSLFKKDIEEEPKVEEPVEVEETFSQVEEYVEEYIEPENTLMVVQLQSYYDMFMIEHGNDVLDYTGIKYIGTNNVTFKINEDESLDKQLVRCIDALLAIEAGRGRTTIVKEFKQFDIREISEAIFKYDTNTRDFPKITASKYCINGVKDVLDLVKILYDVCEQMKIDMGDIFIYANAYTNAVNIVDVYGYDENNVVLYDNLDCQFEGDGTEIAAIVKGDIFNNIIFTHNALNIHSQLIRNAVGVRTKYMSQTIASYDDFLNTVKLLVTNANNNGIDDTIICRCTTLDGRNKLVSTNPDEVGVDGKAIEVNDKTYYVSKVDTWEVAESLLRLHTDVYNDTAIAIKIMLRNNILNFINSEFYTSEPSLALAVYSFRNYINNLLK